MNINKKVVEKLIPVKLVVDERIVRETLSRIGIADERNKTLYPTAYCYKIENQHYICHFKQLFMLTRSNAFDNMIADDYKRCQSIAKYLNNWKMIEVDDSVIQTGNSKVFVLSFKDKKDWVIKHKFNCNNL
jgi:hypothetical protein